MSDGEELDVEKFEVHIEKLMPQIKMLEAEIGNMLGLLEPLHNEKSIREKTLEERIAATEKLTKTREELEGLQATLTSKKNAVESDWEMIFEKLKGRNAKKGDSKLKELVKRLEAERIRMDKQINEMNQGLAFITKQIEKMKNTITTDEQRAIGKVASAVQTELEFLKGKRKIKCDILTHLKKKIRKMPVNKIIQTGDLPKPRFLINPRANKDTVNNPQKRTQ